MTQTKTHSFRPLSVSTMGASAALALMLAASSAHAAPTARTGTSATSASAYSHELTDVTAARRHARRHYRNNNNAAAAAMFGIVAGTIASVAAAQSRPDVVYYGRPYGGYYGGPVYYQPYDPAPFHYNGPSYYHPNYYGPRIPPY